MRHIIISALIIILSGCSADSGLSLPTIFDAYSIEIQQGNALKDEEVDKLKVGMSKEQVRYVMGTPVIADPYHSDRWDYVYYLEDLDNKKNYGRLNVYFEKDSVSRIERVDLN